MSLRLLLASCVFWTLPLCAGSLTVAYTANRQGEIKPCGCKIREIGGLSRMEKRISQLRKKGGVLFVDAGNAFFQAPKLAESRLSAAKKQAQQIAQSYKRMGLKAISPGERDFAAGAGFFWELVKESGAHPVSANLESLNGVGGFESFLIWEEEGFKIALTGLTAFESIHDSQEIRASDPRGAMRSVWKSIQAAKPQQVIVLSHLGTKTDEELAKEFPGVWIVGSKSMEYYETPKKVEKSYLFEVGIEGQRLGEVSLDQAKTGWTLAQLTELGEEYDIPARKPKRKK